MMIIFYLLFAQIHLTFGIEFPKYTTIKVPLLIKMQQNGKYVRESRTQKKKRKHKNGANAVDGGEFSVYSEIILHNCITLHHPLDAAIGMNLEM